MSDSALEAIRTARIAISAECGHDPARLQQHYQDLQAHFLGRCNLERLTPQQNGEAFGPFAHFSGTAHDKSI